MSDDDKVSGPARFFAWVIVWLIGLCVLAVLVVILRMILGICGTPTFHF